MLFVVSLGMGTVFLGLICIILLTELMGWLLNRTPQIRETEIKQVSGSAQISAMQPAISPEVIAVILTVLSERLGVQPAEITITDINKVN